MSGGSGRQRKRRGHQTPPLAVAGGPRGPKGRPGLGLPPNNAPRLCARADGVLWALAGRRFCQTGAAAERPAMARVLSANVVSLGLLALSATWPRAARAKAPGEGPPPRRNVLGGPLQPCCADPNGPIGGYLRDGTCRYVPGDAGAHVVCARMTARFLAFTRAAGNDLSTPRPEHRFPGLRVGDAWCLCAARWREALAAGEAPPVVLEATDVAALQVVSLDELRAHAAPVPAPPRTLPPASDAP